MLYCFDQFVLDTDRFEISKDGSPLRAEPQVIELLTYFVRNSGRLVTRDELVEAVWNGRVVSDSAISGRIKIARKLLGDNGRRQKYIRTIHKKGFSFTAQAYTDKEAPPSTPAAQTAGRRHDSRPSLGVLGFTSPDGDDQRRYFADGLAEELITTLSKIAKLVVVAHPQSPQVESGNVDAHRSGSPLRSVP